MAMKCNWAISLETITEESAEQGIEADGYPISLDCPPRWFTSYSGQVFPTGDYVNTSLHIPQHVTASSRIRIARLLRIIK